MAQREAAMMEVKKEKQAKKDKSDTNDYFGVKLSPPEWLMKETTFGLDPQHIQESLFTLGNGFIGSRGMFEERPERGMAGTYIAGVFDKSGAQSEEMINLPNPINLHITADGEKIDMGLMGFVDHVRYLDMRKGLLARRTLFKDGRGRKYLYKSLRFFSMSNPHISWMKVSITLLNGKAKLAMVDLHDDTVGNYGGLIYGLRRHVHLRKADTIDGINYYAYKTHTSNIWITYADSLTLEKEHTNTQLDERVHIFDMNAKETATFTKTIAISTSLHHPVAKLKENTMLLLKKVKAEGFEKNIAHHENAWAKRWENTNVEINGDNLCDRALRFNIYHLLIAAHKGKFPMSIGARALTGQGYRGHIFWDSEIFMLPFYLYTDPVVAKDMLLYRYLRLDAARNNAKKRGFKGALFPWESGMKGDEATPRYAKDTDGSIMDMDTIDYEHHISGDIAFAVFNYIRVTGDVDFMIRVGAEIIFSTARFWASRVAFNEKRKKYEITDVIGPDEFHSRVKNNAYTNILASWNMEYAHVLYNELKVKNARGLKKIADKLGIKDKEVDVWKKISEAVYIPRGKDNIIEQFEGYFKKKAIAIKSYDNFFMPEAPRHLSYRDFDKTQFVKQADTLLLFYLFPERFTPDEKIKNYRYYMERTLHQSSLSHSTHALLSSEFKDCIRAYLFFLFSAQVDLKNLHNNTDGGMHMANVGGVWQAAIFGFAGVSNKNGVMSINPRLPSNWHFMKFKLFWKSSLLNITVSNKKIDITYSSHGSRKDTIEIEIDSKIYSVKPSETISVKIKKEAVMMKHIKDIIKPEHFVFANENDSIKDVSRVLREKGLSSIPIVNGDRILCGIISKKDIVGVTEKDDFSQLKAKDVMSKSVEYIKAYDHVEIALRLFTERSYQMLPVVKGKTLIGCITRDEILSSCSKDSY